jgi:hypothetical protein
MTKPTKEQIRAALEYGDDINRMEATGKKPSYDENHIRNLSAAYRATQRPAYRIAEIITHAVISGFGLGIIMVVLAGLLAAVKVLVGAVG